ncbi:MAG: hypothetical protein JXA21_08265 [Anaerolineae bacterium]|nr:hypothetical protein [Anaerolineae bacterium]
MRPTKALWHGALLLFILCLMNAGQGLAAPTAQANLSITSPTEGSTLSGTVSIQGTATHSNFESYGVLYATGSNVTAETNWRLDLPITWNVRSMVVNGELGVWDTTQVPNGQYVLALVVYEVGNTNPNVHFVNNLTVFNQEATPTPEVTETPTPDPNATPTPDPLQPAAGVTPAVATVELPPTGTPRPTATLAPDVASSEEDDEEGFNPADILSGAAIKEAFVTGVWLAIFLYAMGGIYVLAKAAVRYYLRQMRRRQRS